MKAAECARESAVIKRREAGSGSKGSRRGAQAGGKIQEEGATRGGESSDDDESVEQSC